MHGLGGHPTRMPITRQCANLRFTSASRRLPVRVRRHVIEFAVFRTLCGEREARESDRRTDMKTADALNDTMDGHPVSSWQLGYVLDVCAETAGGSTALIIGAERHRVTYTDLAELVVAHCAALLRYGLRPGDVIAIQATNSIEFVVALL